MQEHYPWWRRALAQVLFVWGQSVSYWGNILMSDLLYRWAAGSYSYALKAWPEFAKAYLRRGAIRGRELDDYTGAIRDLSRAIELEPEWPESYLQRGLLYRFHGASTADRALDDLRRYLELGPSDSWRGEAERLIVNLENEISDRRSRTGGG